MLYRLVYMSTANNLFSESQLEDLLEISKKNNKEINVTGLLLTKGKTFIQCLEGQKQDVEYIYSKIKKDDRHHDVVELVEETIFERIFNDWSMGYRNIELLTSISTPKMKEIHLDDIKSLKNDDLYELFGYFLED